MPHPFSLSSARAAIDQGHARALHGRLLTLSFGWRWAWVHALWRLQPGRMEELFEVVDHALAVRAPQPVVRLLLDHVPHAPAADYRFRAWMVQAIQQNRMDVVDDILVRLPFRNRLAAVEMGFDEAALLGHVAALRLFLTKGPPLSFHVYEHAVQYASEQGHAGVLALVLEHYLPRQSVFNAALASLVGGRHEAGLRVLLASASASRHLLLDERDATTQQAIRDVLEPQPPVTVAVMPSRMPVPGAPERTQPMSSVMSLPAVWSLPSANDPQHDLPPGQPLRRGP